MTTMPEAMQQETAASPEAAPAMEAAIIRRTVEAAPETEAAIIKRTVKAAAPAKRTARAKARLLLPAAVSQANQVMQASRASQENRASLDQVQRNGDD